MKYVLSLLFFAFSLSAVAQTAGQLTGKWVYTELYEAKKLNAQDAQMSETFFEGMAYTFHEDETITVAMMGEERTGPYELKKGNIVVSDPSGFEYKIKIIDYSPEKLIVEYRNVPAVLIPADSVAEVVEEEYVSPAERTPVAASTKQVSKKWMIGIAKDPKKNVASIALEAAIIEGGFFQFKENGKVITRIMDEENRGDWSFGDDKTTLVTNIDGEEATWTITEISSSSLELIKNGTEVWVFSSDE